MMIQRRSFLTGLAAAFVGPAIIPASNLMRVRKVIIEPRLPIIRTAYKGHQVYLRAIVVMRSDGEVVGRLIPPNRPVRYYVEPGERLMSEGTWIKDT